MDEGQITPEPTEEPGSGENLTSTPTLEEGTPEATPTPAGNALSVLHLSWDGSRWSQPEEIVSISGDVPEWPRIAVGLGNQLHVTWFVRDQAHIFGGEGASRYRIWYAQKQIDAPAQTPVLVWPTQEISQSLATPPDLEPTPEILDTTPTPTMAPALSQTVTENLVYSEQGYLQVVAFSLVPVVALLALVLMVFKVRGPK
jgi:hypothetical protein